MKAIIIEDEKLSAEHLMTLLKKTDVQVEIIATYDSVKKTIEQFKKGVKADLLFVDVHLADGLSFEIFANILVETPVIFTTAYDEYAIQAFKINSVDYLLKPIGISDLQKALDKFKKWTGGVDSAVLENLANAYQHNNKQYKNRFIVKMGDTISSVKTDEIAHFISEDGLVLASQYTCNFGGHSSEHRVGSVNDVPVACDLGFFWVVRAHGGNLLIKRLFETRAERP